MRGLPRILLITANISMNRQQFELSAHVHMCIVQDQMVFLDLRRDKYSCIDKESTSVLRKVLPRSPSFGMLQPDVYSKLKELAASGLVSIAEGEAQRYRPTQRDTHVTASSALTPGYEVGGPSPMYGPVSAYNFLRATALAAYRLRHQSIYAVLAAEIRRQARHGQERFDFDRAARLIKTFDSLRLFVTGRRRCLADSLALRIFLSSYRLHPRWIFGVRLRPFAAHCWLQRDSVVLNDDLDFVKGFETILVI